jgi:hypothetical protein
VVDSKNETITTPRLSFRFLNVGPGAERELRIIYSLERRRGNAQIKFCEKSGSVTAARLRHYMASIAFCTFQI